MGALIGTDIGVAVGAVVGVTVGGSVIVPGVGILVGDTTVPTADGRSVTLGATAVGDDGAKIVGKAGSIVSKKVG